MNKKIILFILLVFAAVVFAFGSINQNKFMADTKSENTTPKNTEGSIYNKYYSLFELALNISKTNGFEENINPSMFNFSNISNEDKANINFREQNITRAQSIEAYSALEFSKKYAKQFSSSFGLEVGAYGVNVNVAGRFKKSENNEFIKNREEKYEYFYWLAEKFSTTVNWKKEGFSKKYFSDNFKKEVNDVKDVFSAKKVLEKYGSHVFETYILGGKLEITKYFAKEASYELKEEEKEIQSSLSIIVDAAKVSAKLNGSVDLSKYEKDSSKESKIENKLNYQSFGGDINGAANVSDLFQYKTQFATGTASGFLYEAWTNSFNKNDAVLKVVSASNPIPVWEIFSDDIVVDKKLFEEAYDIMLFENYATNSDEIGVSTNYISEFNYEYKVDIKKTNKPLETKTKEIQIKPQNKNLFFPTNTKVTFKLDDEIENKFGSQIEYKLFYEDSGVNADSNIVEVSNKQLIIKNKEYNERIILKLLVNNIEIYRVYFTIKDEKYLGYGTEQQPYLINTKEEFKSFLTEKILEGQKFMLMEDIDMEGQKIEVYGSGDSSSFLGIFDGNGHKIYNLTVLGSKIKSNFNFIGIFGKNEGTIKNLKLENVKVLNSRFLQPNVEGLEINAGILVGYNLGIIENVKIENSVIRLSVILPKNSNSMNVGIIAGKSTGKIKFVSVSENKLYVNAQKGKGEVNIGGVSGKIENSSIEQSLVRITQITLNDKNKEKFNVGGIVGKMVKNLTSLSSVKPSLNMCVVYDLEKNKSGNSFGYISGYQEEANFYNCYYIGIREESVSGRSFSNCTKVNELKIGNMPHVFRDKWKDGDKGLELK